MGLWSTRLISRCRVCVGLWSMALISRCRVCVGLISRCGVMEYGVDK